MVPTTRFTFRIGSVARTGSPSVSAGAHSGSSVVASSDASTPCSCAIVLWRGRSAGHVGLGEDPGEVQAARLPVVERRAHLQAIGAPDHLVDRPEAQARHVLPHLAGDERHEVDDVLRLACEPPAQLRVLRGHAHRTGVQMAGAHHHAAQRHQRRRGEPELLRAQQCADDDVAAGLELPVHLDHDPCSAGRS